MTQAQGAPMTSCFVGKSNIYLKTVVLNEALNVKYLTHSDSNGFIHFSPFPLCHTPFTRHLTYFTTLNTWIK